VIGEKKLKKSPSINRRKYKAVAKQLETTMLTAPKMFFRQILFRFLIRIRKTPPR
jgi:hypothetical protein